MSKIKLLKKKTSADNLSCPSTRSQTLKRTRGSEAMTTRSKSKTLATQKETGKVVKRKKVKTSTCCIVGIGGRCPLEASTTELSKKLLKNVKDKHLDLKNDARAQHQFICLYHKVFIENAPDLYQSPLRYTVHSSEKEETVNNESSNPSTPKDEEENNFEQDSPQFNWSLLAKSSLEKYVKMYGLPGTPDSTKEELISIVTDHFGKIDVRDKEDEIVSNFVVNIRHRRDNEKKEESNHLVILCQAINLIQNE